VDKNNRKLSNETSLTADTQISERFDVLLTVHLSIILVDNQLDAQNLALQ